MSNTRRTMNINAASYTGKQTLLPPKSPFSSTSPSSFEYASNQYTQIQKSKDQTATHQRTSSAGFLIDEQPSWLDDLLSEPDIPMGKGVHRRSSSDSFPYIDACSVSKTRNLTQMFHEYRHNSSSPCDSIIDRYNDTNNDSHNTEAEPSARHLIKEGQSQKKEQDTTYRQDVKVFSDARDCTKARNSDLEPDKRWTKQQYAQRSRVRKIQYIQDLERHVQALQVEGSEISAELKFLDQQNIILTMENEALKRRLDSLAQEKVIKSLEYEILDRQITRLKTLYQKQQQQQETLTKQFKKSPNGHNHSSIKDLDSQFASLSFGQEIDSNQESGKDPGRTKLIGRDQF